MPAATTEESAISRHSTRRPASSYGASIPCHQPAKRPRLGRANPTNSKPEAGHTLDPEAGLLYSPVGNPGPDFVAEYRSGDNLYTCSVIILDARTGELKGYRQFVKNDFHDWDMAASPILFTSRAGRKMVAAAGKNGYLYGLSRDLQELFFQIPVTRIENVDAPLTTEGTRFLPGVHGGTNF